MSDILVIGGGITGASTAYWLSCEGHRVTLLEERSIAAMGSGWSLGGVRRSGRDAAELDLAKLAVSLWPTLDERLDASTEYRQNGNLRLARTPAEVDSIRRMIDEQTALGLEMQFLPDIASVHAVAPAVSDTVLAASFCPSDGHANPALSTRAFAVAASRNGAVVRQGIAVDRIIVADGRVRGVVTREGEISASTVVVAAGIGTPRLLSPLGLALPLHHSLVTVMQTPPQRPQFAQVFGVANADCAGRQEVDGRFRVTSGIESWHGDVTTWTTQDLAPEPAAIDRLRARIAGVLPVIGSLSVGAVWGGLIDLTPDALPVIDAPPEIGGLIVAAGFSGHGFCIGPATGQVVCDLALRRAPRLPLDAFRLSRFKFLAGVHADLTLHG